jgi:hypothetical protein
MNTTIKRLTVTLTGKPPIQIDTQNWPIVAASTDQPDGPVKPKHKLTIRSNNQVYVVYSVAYPEPGIKAKPLRAGESVCGLNAVIDAAYRVGEAVGMPEAEIRKVIEKLPPVDQSMDHQIDMLMFLDSGTFFTITTTPHSETTELEHIALTAFIAPGGGLSKHFTQPTGKLQDFFKGQKLFIEEDDTRTLFIAKPKEIWAAAIKGDKVEIKTAAGVHAIKPKDSPVKLIERLSKFSKYPLITPPYSCAHCKFMHMDPDEVGSEASNGAFYCHITEDAGMSWDPACPCFEKDESPERQAELAQWRKDGIVKD